MIIVGSQKVFTKCKFTQILRVFVDVSFQPPVLQNLILKFSEGFEKIRQFGLFWYVNCDVHSQVSLCSLFKDVKRISRSPLTSQWAFVPPVLFVLYSAARPACCSNQYKALNFFNQENCWETLPFTVLSSHFSTPNQILTLTYLLALLSLLMIAESFCEWRQ